MPTKAHHAGADARSGTHVPTPASVVIVNEEEHNEKMNTRTQNALQTVKEGNFSAYVLSVLSSMSYMYADVYVTAADIAAEIVRRTSADCTRRELDTLVRDIGQVLWRKRDELFVTDGRIPPFDHTRHYYPMAKVAKGYRSTPLNVGYGEQHVPEKCQEVTPVTLEDLHNELLGVLGRISHHVTYMENENVRLKQKLSKLQAALDDA